MINAVINERAPAALITGWQNDLTFETWKGVQLNVMATIMDVNSRHSVQLFNHPVISDYNHAERWMMMMCDLGMVVGSGITEFPV